MEFFRIYRRVLGLLGPERRLGIILAVANVVVASLAYLEPVLFGRIVDVLSKGASMPPAETWAASVRILAIWGAVGLAGIVANYPRFAECGSPRAPPPVGGDGALFRTRAEPSALVPQPIAFRPRAEGHAGRGRQSVRHLARLLPRAPRHVHRHPRPAAAVAFPELATGCAADRPDRHFRGTHGARHLAHREGAGAGGGIPLAPRRRAPAMRSATYRSSTATCGWRPKPARSRTRCAASSSPSIRCSISGPW